MSSQEVSVIVRVGTDTADLQKLPAEVQRTVGAMGGSFSGASEKAGLLSRGIGGVGGALKGIGQAAYAINNIVAFSQKSGDSMVELRRRSTQVRGSLNNLGPAGQAAGRAVDSGAKVGSSGMRRLSGDANKTQQSFKKTGTEAQRSGGVIKGSMNAASASARKLGAGGQAAARGFRSIRPAANAVSSLSRALGAAARGTGKMRDATARAGREYKNSGNSAMGTVRVLRTMGGTGVAELRKVGRASSKAATDMAKLGRNSHHSSDQMRDANGRFAKAQSVLGGLGKIIGGGGGGLVGAFAILGPAVLAAAAAMIAIKVAGIALHAVMGLVKGALKMDHEVGGAYDRIRIDMGLVGEAADKAKISLDNIAKTTATPLVELAGTMTALASRTGATGPVLEGMTQQISNLSRLTGTDAKQNVELLTRAMGDWGVPLDQSASKFDLLFRASQNTGVGIDRISRLVVQFGAPMRSFGFSFEESAAMLGVWEQKGVNTELVMGSLRIAGGKLAEAGIPLREGLKTGIEAIQAVESSSEAAALAADLFGTRAGIDMADTIRGGKFAVDEFVNTIANGKDTINQAAEDTMGFAEVTTLFKNKMTVAIAPIATAFSDKLASGFKIASDALFAFVDSPAGQMVLAMLQSLVSTIADYLLPTLAALGVAAGIAGVLIGAALLPVIASILVAIAPILIGIGALVLIFKALMDGAGETEKTFSSMGEAFDANAESVTGVADSAESVVDRIKAAWNDAKASVSDSVASLTSWIQSKFQSAKAFLHSVHAAVKKSLTGAWTTIKVKVSTTIATLINWVKKAVSAWINFLIKIVTTLVNLWVKAWRWVIKTIVGLVNKGVLLISTVFLGLGKFIGKVQDAIGDVIHKVWTGILNIFKSVATPIVNGMKALFTGIVNIVKNGMLAAGGIVDKVMTAIAKKISDLASSLGVVGSAIAGIATRIAATASGWLEDIGSGIDAMTAKIGQGLDGIVGKFSGGISSVRQRVGGIMDRFSLGDIGKDLGVGDDADYTADGVSGGGDEDLSGLSGDDEGSGGSEAWKSPDGMSGADSDGSEWYIDNDTGQKVYTSGPGMNKQQAKFRGQEAKRAEADGKKKGAKKAAEGANVASTIANTAEKVAKAIEKGLESIRALSDTEIPGEDIWRPKLDALEGFLSETLSSFDRIGQGLLGQAGTTADGGDILQTDKAKGITGVTALLGGLMQTMSSGLSFLNESTTAKLPTPEQLDAVLSQLFGLLESIRDRGIELAAVFEAEGSADNFKEAAQGIGLWVQIWGQVAEGAVAVGTAAEQIAQAPAAMASIESVLTEIGAMSGRMVELFRAAVPEEDRSLLLALSRNISSTMNVWLGTIIQMGQGVEALRAVRRIPSDVGTHIETFLMEIGRISGLLVAGMEKTIASRTGQQDSLNLTSNIARAFGNWFAMLDLLGKAARGLRDIARIPTSVTRNIEGFLTSIALITGTFVTALRSVEEDDVAAMSALSVSEAVSKTFIAAIQMISTLAASAQGIVDIPLVPSSAIQKVDSTLHAVADILRGFVVGEGFNLLMDVQGSLAAQGVIQSVIATLQQSLSLLGSLATIGTQFAEAVPLNPMDVDVAIRNLDHIRNRMIEWAQKWTAGMEDITDGVAEIRQSLNPYIAIVKDTMGAFMDAQKLTLSDITPINESDLQTAMENAFRVVEAVRRWADAWMAALGVGGGESGSKGGGGYKNPVMGPDAVGGEGGGVVGAVGDVAESIRVYVAVVKDAVGLALDAAKLSLTDVKPLNDADIAMAMNNVTRVLNAVAAGAREWVQSLKDTGVKLENVTAETKAFHEIAGPAIDLIGKTNEVLLKMSEKVAPGNLQDGIKRMIRFMILVLMELADAFDQVEAEVGRLKKAKDITEVMGPAAESLAKILDAFSLEKLMKNPLVSTKIESGPLSTNTATRLDHMAQQISEGVRRMVNALIDGLSGITVPDNLGAGLMRILDVYLRVAEILERIRDLDLGADMGAKIQEVAELMALLAMSMAAPPSIGEAASGPGSDPDPAYPGVVKPGSGAPGTPVVPGQPVKIDIKLDGKTLETIFASVQGASTRAENLLPIGTG